MCQVGRMFKLIDALFLVLLFNFILFRFGFCQECEIDAKTAIEQENECLVLTLENSITRALNYNRQLVASVDARLKSQFGVVLADSNFNIQISPNGQAGYAGGGRAGSGPSLGGGFDLSKKFTPGTVFTVSPSVAKIGRHYHTDLRAVISQPLLRGFGQDYQLSPLKGAEFALRSASRALYIAQLQLVTRTIQALYEVIKAKKAVLLNEESFSRIIRFHQAAKLKERIGLSDALDVYRAEIELRHAQDDLTSSQERLQETEDALRELLALPLNTCIEVNVPLNYLENDIGLDEAISLALKNRIEISQAEDQVQENYRLSRIAKKNLYPDLNLVMNYSNCGTDEIFSRACTRHRESTWGIGFTTSTDFDPVGDRVAYEQSLVGIQGANRGAEQAQATVILEVKKALRHLERTDKRILLQAEQIKTAEGELYLSQLKFDRGMADNFNIIQAEKSFRSAQLSYWSALIDHIVGEYQFLLALGLLTDKPIIH
jgi:outer membrane protein